MVAAIYWFVGNDWESIYWVCQNGLLPSTDLLGITRKVFTGCVKTIAAIYRLAGNDLENISWVFRTAAAIYWLDGNNCENIYWENHNGCCHLGNWLTRNTVDYQCRRDYLELPAYHQQYYLKCRCSQAMTEGRFIKWLCSMRFLHSRRWVCSKRWMLK